MTMPQEPDYKAAYEILEEALRNADRILRQAQLRTALRLERERASRPRISAGQNQIKQKPLRCSGSCLFRALYPIRRVSRTSLSK